MQIAEAAGLETSPVELPIIPEPGFGHGGERLEIIAEFSSCNF